MQTVRSFNVTTISTSEGVVYSYDSVTGIFVGISIKDKFPVETVKQILTTIKTTLKEFLEWCKVHQNITVVELQQQINFDIFWSKYNDKLRSSKKRSQRLWEKLKEADQVKAFYYIDTYNRHRGNAEKKYCETYLSAELWNN